jgi:IS30 family transposase
MSFSEELEALVRLIDGGSSVSVAAAALGISVPRAYWLVRENRPGLLRRVSRTSLTDEHRALVVDEFTSSGSINKAAGVAGLSHGAARRILVRAGLVPAETATPGKAGARERFFVLLEQGWSKDAASREVGIHPRTGQDWVLGVRKQGKSRIYPDGRVVDYRAPSGYSRGMNTVTTSRTGGRFLSLADRLVIADGVITGQSLTTIAALVHKSVSTISREVRAHSVNGLYLPHQADRDAAAARARPKAAKLLTNPELRAAVEHGLARRLSPEQISRRLVKEHPSDENMRVSHETIYQALYFQARGGLKREVQAALRSGRTRRKPHRHPDERTPRFATPMVMISDRPAEVDDRAVPGHWEGDLIMGTNNKSAIGTLVERSTRYTMLVHLPHGHDAEQVRDGLLEVIATLPQHLRGSLTWDQGSEMARHQQITMATDMQIYFCDPASPWQRGSNENTNGLLRQYFPKGTDLSIYGKEDLEHVAQELNGRPRKTLDWDTPAERLRNLITN